VNNQSEGSLEASTLQASPLTQAEKDRNKAALETRNVDWTLIPESDGNIPIPKLTAALLLDIREATRSIRRMVLFFTVLAIINCIAFIFWFTNALTK
jgi:hypothetical protein